jgi:hypothetical protein
MEIPAKITRAPSAFARYQEVANFLLDFARIVKNAQGKNGIKILVTDQNMVIENDPDGGDQDGAGGTGGPLPAGYREAQATICEDGTTKTVTILVKD